MALVLKDRVKETSTTTGTGTFTLGGAAPGFQSFSVVGNGNTTYYAIYDSVTGSWEVGVGTYTLSGTTLSRDTVLESSNAGSLVNFAAGNKDVFCTYPAERAVTDVSATSPVASTGGNSPVISLSAGYGDTLNPYATKPTLTFLAAPNGGGVPAFRVIAAADIPTLNQNTTGTAANVTGTVAIANGGTGATTRQNAMDALAGATTSGQYLRGNGTDVVMAAIVAGDVPTLNQNTTGSSASCTGNAATATTAVNLSTTRANWSTNGVITAVVGQLAWKNYNNNHTIFDASAGTSPDGGAVNNTTAAVPWSATYPSLMGWNGSQTYGLRVDSARVADSATTAPAPTTAQVLSATAGAAAGDVGSYAFLARVAGKASSPAGTTIAGSNLRYSNAYSNNDQANEGSNSVSPSGTWMIMGNTGYLNLGTANTADGFMMTLFLRIS